MDFFLLFRTLRGTPSQGSKSDNFPLAANEKKRRNKQQHED